MKTVFVSLLVLLVVSTKAAARWPDSLDTEQSIADQMTGTPQKGWALLPEVGFSPDKGGNVGAKLAVHEIPPVDLSADIEAVYALKGQTQLSFHLVDREFLSEYLLAIVEADILRDPTKEFFGLGNNDSGPDELSTHEEQTLSAEAALGVRPIPRLTLAASIGYREIDVRHGKLEGDTPSTRRTFPNLVGIDGGTAHPVGLSITYNNREDPARPTQGWILMAKAQHVNEALDNDFELTRYSLDVSYLIPLLTRRQVVGLRVGGEILDGGNREIPFWELSELGSSDTLRGYFADRFLGDARVLGSAEYRLKLVDFNLIWFVQIDGVAFGEIGRVFIDDDRLEAQSGCPDPFLPPPLGPSSSCRPLPETEDDFRFSYGGGTRIALGKALIARIDVGFSPEEKGLVYLVFGQTF